MRAPARRATERGSVGSVADDDEPDVGCREGSERGDQLAHTLLPDQPPGVDDRPVFIHRSRSWVGQVRVELDPERHRSDP